MTARKKTAPVAAAEGPNGGRSDSDRWPAGASTGDARGGGVGAISATGRPPRPARGQQWPRAGVTGRAAEPLTPAPTGTGPGRGVSCGATAAMTASISATSGATPATVKCTGSGESAGRWACVKANSDRLHSSFRRCTASRSDRIASSDRTVPDCGESGGDDAAGNGTTAPVTGVGTDVPVDEAVAEAVLEVEAVTGPEPANVSVRATPSLLSPVAGPDDAAAAAPESGAPATLLPPKPKPKLLRSDCSQYKKWDQTGDILVSNRLPDLLIMA